MNKSFLTAATLALAMATNGAAAAENKAKKAPNKLPPPFEMTIIGDRPLTCTTVPVRDKKGIQVGVRTTCTLQKGP